MTTRKAKAPAAPLADVIAQAKELAGDEWGQARTWPLEAGLIWLAEKLKG
jgi:hypothetical protein